MIRPQIYGQTSISSSFVNASVTATELLSRADGALGLTFFNHSPGSLFLKFGPAASLTNFNVKIPSGSLYQVPLPIHSGTYTGIWDALGGGVAISYPYTTNVAEDYGRLRDGPEGWTVPESSDHFSALGLATPDHLFLCQDLTGNLVSVFSPLLLAPNLSNSTSYNQSVGGWRRKFLGTDGVTANQRWASASASLDLALGESVAIMALVSLEVPPNGTTRMLMSWGGSTGNGLNVSAPTAGVIAGTPRVQFNGVAASSTTIHGSTNADTVHLICVYRNAAGDISGYESDLDGFKGTHSEVAITGQSKGFWGGGTSFGLKTRLGWFAIWKGVNAEQDWKAYVNKLMGR